MNDKSDTGFLLKKEDINYVESFLKYDIENEDIAKYPQLKEIQELASDYNEEDIINANLIRHYIYRFKYNVGNNKRNLEMLILYLCKTKGYKIPEKKEEIEVDLIDDVSEEDLDAFDF